MPCFNKTMPGHTNAATTDATALLYLQC